MFTGCFLVLLCLLLGGPLEARPLPKIKDLQLRVGNREDYMDRPKALKGNMMGRIHLSLQETQWSQQRFKVLLKNRYKGNFRQSRYFPRRRMMKGSTSFPDVIKVAHNLQDKENMFHSTPNLEKTIENIFSTVIKWVMICLGIQSACMFLGVYFMKIMRNKHDDKIPTDKVVDMQTKTEQEKNEHPPAIETP